MSQVKKVPQVLLEEQWKVLAVLRAWTPQVGLKEGPPQPLSQWSWEVRTVTRQTCAGTYLKDDMLPWQRHNET